MRQPVLKTGMGKISPIGDSEALAETILSVLENPSAFQKDSSEIRAQFEPQQSAAAYLQLFEELLVEA